MVPRLSIETLSKSPYIKYMVLQPHREEVTKHSYSPDKGLTLKSNLNPETVLRRCEDRRNVSPLSTNALSYKKCPHFVKNVPTSLKCRHFSKLSPLPTNILNFNKCPHFPHVARKQEVLSQTHNIFISKLTIFLFSSPPQTERESLLALLWKLF